MAEWWDAAEAAVAAYTGLTPAAFFTAVAVAVALYVAVSGLLARPARPSARSPDQEAAEQEEERAAEPLPPPVQLGEVTEEELRAYDGSDPTKPLLMAIKGQIYDVTQSRMFYGPGGPYALFAGRDASRALAKMSFEPIDLSGDISGLGPFEVEALQEWEYKFKSKYVTVGIIKKTTPVAETDTESGTGTVERAIDTSTIESKLMQELKEKVNANQRSIVETTQEAPDAYVNASGHDDVEGKAEELLDSDVMNTGSHADAAKKTEETPDVAATNRSNTEDADEQKETQTPQVVDETNTSKPGDPTEKTNEAQDTVDAKNTASHEDGGQPNDTRNVDEKDVGKHHDDEDKTKEALDAEAKNE